MTKYFTIAGVALAAVGFSLPQSVEASPVSVGSYFVRPTVQVAGAFIDGLQQNGVTSASQNYTSDFQSTVDLEDGTVKARMELHSAQSHGQSGGSFGERLTFSPNAVGTNVNFTFDFHGSIDVPDLLPGPLASGYQALVFASFYVYDSATGATWQNFNSQSLTGDALIARSFTKDYGTPYLGTPTETFFDIQEVLGGSLNVEANKMYDVFASLSVAAVTGDNDISIEMDFMNTGTFGIDTAAGVTYSSSSGVFLDSNGTTPPPSVVPLPAGLPLLAGALAFFGLIGRRRQTKAS